MWIIDSNVYIRAFNDARFGAELTRFHAAHLPRIVLSAVVLFELLVASRTAAARRRLRKGLWEPYQRRGQIHVPTPSTWDIAADVERVLREHRAAGRLRDRSFANDLLIAASARQLGATIVSENVAQFAILGRLLDVEHTPPWPRS